MPEPASTEAMSATSEPLSKEEEKWRDLLRSKREEERLRNLIRDKNRSKVVASSSTAAPTGASESTKKASNVENSANGSNDQVKKKESKEDVRIANESTKNDSVEGSRHSRRHDRRDASRGGDSGGSRKRSRSPRRRSNSPGRNHRLHRQDRRHRHPDHHGHHNRSHRPHPRGGIGPDTVAPPMRHAHARPDFHGPPPVPYYDRNYRGGDSARRPNDLVYDDDIDPYGRQRRSRPADDRLSRPYSSSSRSHSRSPGENKINGKRARRRGRSRSRSVSSYSSRGSNRSNSSQSSRSSASSESSKLSTEDVPEDELYSKDQRTIFINQLVMRTTEKEIARFFKAKKIPTNEIILLRDKRTGKHKGSAYVELKRMADVIAAVNLSGQAPDFQRFPILIKASEAERNYAPSGTSTISIPVASAVAAAAGAPVAVSAAQPIKLPPLTDANGKPVQAQKVYVGNLEANLVTSQHLHALFAPFGTLTEIQLQVGKGFAFLQFHDPKEAALAIQTMSGQLLAGRPMKTGWATNQGIINGMELVTSSEFPPDAATRAQNAYIVLAQLTSGHMTAPAVAQSAPLFATGSSSTVSATSSSRVPTVAEARASLAAAANGSNSATMGGILPQGPAVLGVVPQSVGNSTTAVVDPTKIGNAEHPTQHVLVHNMFNKDEETEPDWEKDIRDEFEEECTKYGKILSVTVMSKEPGGKIYVNFDSLDGAKTCASSLAGRWFDKRQLRVEYVSDDEIQRVTKSQASTA
jgi:RNA-binding protein 23/39